MHFLFDRRGVCHVGSVRTLRISPVPLAQRRAFFFFLLLFIARRKVSEKKIISRLSRYNIIITPNSITAGRGYVFLRWISITLLKTPARVQFLVKRSFFFFFFLHNT